LKRKSLLPLLVLVFAGEGIFVLPFVLARVFRPTLLEVFSISNTELGTYFSVYGVVAMLSYAFGGPLADRFPTRNLMAIALWATGLSGFVFAKIPGKEWMMVLYAFWGFTTIFLFWAGMIKATREWGDHAYHSRAFGWLESGRGITAGLLGTAMVTVFANQEMPGTMNDPTRSLQVVIFSASVIVILTGFLVWFVLPASTSITPDPPTPRTVLKIAGKPEVWLLATLIVCGYVGYKITDLFSLYAKSILNFSDLQAATLGSLILWMRVPVSFLLGIWADRTGAFKVITLCFIVNVVFALVMSAGTNYSDYLFIVMNFTFLLIGIYGVRALYFAILDEVNISMLYTGTVVGIVSFVGFTPEIFIGPLTGYLLDSNPGQEGFRQVFVVLALFSAIGLTASLLLRKYAKPAVQH
jgi:nitrate/nitrite transporter NarK